MDFFKYYNVDNLIVEQLNELHQKCCAFDGVAHPFYACDEEISDAGMNNSKTTPAAYVYKNDDGIIIAALTIYYINELECQIYALTHSDFRNQGYFTSLFNEFSKDAVRLGINNISIPVDPDNIQGKNILLSINGVSFNHTEFILMYDCNSYSDFHADLPEISILTDKYKINDCEVDNCKVDNCEVDNCEVDNCEVNNCGNSEFENVIVCHCILDNTAIGSCKIDFSYDCATIFDFEIHMSFRRKGYGSAFLSKVIDYILKYEKNILLQVSGANTPAYKMYMHHGFKIYSSVDYLVYIAKL